MAVGEKWNEYVAWLKKNVPAAHENLAPPATDEDIAKVERATKLKLPADLKELWSCNNGQKVTMISTSVEPGVPTIPTLTFLSTDAVIDVWKHWASLRRDETPTSLASLNAAGKSVFPETVKPLYTHEGWIPLWSDPARADYIGIDLDPGPKGTRGQIINFGRDEELHAVFAPGVEGLLDMLLAEVKGGGWKKSKMEYGKKKIDWFGEPDAHFFNALQKRRPQAPPEPKTPNQNLAELIAEGEKLVRAKQPEAALAVVEQIRGLGTKPGSRTLNIESRAYEALGRWEDADRVLGELIAVAPKLIEHSVRRATNLLEQIKDPKRAADAVRAGLAITPHEPGLVALQKRLG